MSDVILNVSARSHPALPDLPMCVVLGVLVQHPMEHGYRVYVAIVPDNSLNDPRYELVRDWVVAHGRHASLAEARLFYPNLEEDRYTR